MEIILTQDIAHLGKQSELVKVRPGYARNYLLPKKMAVVANDSQKKIFEEKIKQDARRDEKLMSKLQEIVDTLKNTTFKIVAKAGTSGKIFGSVTNVQIADAIKKQKNINLERGKIVLDEEVKNLGNYTATIRLHKDVEVKISFEVLVEA